MNIILGPLCKEGFLIKRNLKGLLSISTSPPSPTSFWLVSIFHSGCMFRCSTAETVDSVLWKHQAEHREPVWSKSSEHLANPDVESKLPERRYVTVRGADGWTTVLHQRGNVPLLRACISPHRWATLFVANWRLKWWRDDNEHGNKSVWKEGER